MILRSEQDFEDLWQLAMGIAWSRFTCRQHLPCVSLNLDLGGTVAVAVGSLYAISLSIVSIVVLVS